MTDGLGFSLRLFSWLRRVIRVIIFGGFRLCYSLLPSGGQLLFLGPIDHCISVGEWFLDVSAVFPCLGALALVYCIVFSVSSSCKFHCFLCTCGGIRSS